jgi:hypothetical protein
MKLDTDKKFEEIQGLKWLPWIGNDYLNLENENRFLVIGESHYHDNTEQSIKKHNSKDFTKRVIREMAIDRDYYSTKIFQNLNRALFRNDKFDTTIFWNLSAFYNFIQRPMETNKGRPTYNDFYNGWKIFFEVIKEVKPKICLFIGTTAAHSFVDAIKNTEFTTSGIKVKDQISNTYAKTAIIKDKDNNEIEIVFIRHTSKMFSWEKWNKFLMKTIPTQISWFESKLKT